MDKEKSIVDSIVAKVSNTFAEVARAVVMPAAADDYRVDAGVAPVALPSAKTAPRKKANKTAGKLLGKKHPEPTKAAAKNPVAKSSKKAAKNKTPKKPTKKSSPKKSTKKVAKKTAPKKTAKMKSKKR